MRPYHLGLTVISSWFVAVSVPGTVSSLLDPCVQRFMTSLPALRPEYSVNPAPQRYDGLPGWVALTGKSIWTKPPWAPLSDCLSGGVVGADWVALSLLLHARVISSPLLDLMQRPFQWPLQLAPVRAYRRIYKVTQAWRQKQTQVHLDDVSWRRQCRRQSDRERRACVCLWMSQRAGRTLNCLGTSHIISQDICLTRESLAHWGAVLSSYAL